MRLLAIYEHCTFKFLVGQIEELGRIQYNVWHKYSGGSRGAVGVH
jgi:hypothetical protein